jgi:2-polyprenyl-3-methyl-5-hydroxy-6-metoxy-1,4-benzoquinol methylase
VVRRPRTGGCAERPELDGGIINSAYDTDFDPEAPNDARAEALRLVGGNKRVLEFGCATGRVTKALVDRGCRVTGIEIDNDAAEHARAYADEVVVLDLDYDEFEAKLSGQQWEVALFGDVLEHLRDPLRVLRATRQLLDRQGTVVLSVPNVAYADVRLALLNGQFPYGPYGLLDRTHLRFFTRDTITQLLDDAGFVAVDVHRIIMPAFTSELELRRDSFPPAVVDAVLADPEAEAYQYVVRAVIDSGDAVVRDLAERCRQLEQELWATKIRYEVDTLEAAAELSAIKNGRLMRYSAPLRKLYHRFRTAP